MLRLRGNDVVLFVLVKVCDSFDSGIVRLCDRSRGEGDKIENASDALAANE